MNHWRCQSFALVLAFALSACASQTHQALNDAGPNSDASPAPVRPTWTTPTEACDPLKAQELPIQLGTVIAAGKTSTGTLYVVDENPSEPTERVFVSLGNTLYRKRASGSGSSGDSDFTWSFDDDGMNERLVVRKQGDQVTGIALAPPNERTFFDQLDERAQQLTPVAPASLAGFDVRNLPGEVEVEFVADAADGSRIVITRPRDDWSYGDFRVFYGANGLLLERVTSFSGARSYRAFDFIVDGTSWRVVFASMFAPALESEIDTGSGLLPLTLVVPPLVSDADSFECFVRPSS